MAAAVIGIVLTGCMATAVLLVLGICTLLEKLGVLKPDSAESGVAESTESAEVEEVQSAEPPADSPSSVRALVTMGAGLPASRLSPMNPDVPAAPASSVSPRVPGETGHWIRPPAAGGRQSPWSGILVASGRTVDAAQLGELYAVIPREWLN